LFETKWDKKFLNELIIISLRDKQRLEQFDCRNCKPFS